MEEKQAHVDRVFNQGVEAKNAAGYQAGAEAVYQVALAEEEATRLATIAGMGGSTGQQKFNALFEEAKVAWLEATAPYYVARATASAEFELLWKHHRLAVNDGTSPNADYDFSLKTTQNELVSANSQRNFTRLGYWEQINALSRDSSHASEQAKLDIEAAKAEKKHALDVAKADKTLYVARAEEGCFTLTSDYYSPCFSLDPYSDAAFQQHRDDIAYAAWQRTIDLEGAKLTFQQKENDSRKQYSTSVASAAKQQDEQLALIERGAAISQANYQYELDIAYAQAAQSRWVDEADLNSADNFSFAEDDIAWQSAQEAATLAAMEALDEELELPWTGFLVAQADAHQDWWETTGKVSYLQWITGRRTNENTWTNKVRGAQMQSQLPQITARRGLAINAATTTNTQKDSITHATYNYQAGVTGAGGTAAAAKKYLDDLAKAHHDKAIELAENQYLVIASQGASSDSQGEIEGQYDDLIAGYQTTYTTAETGLSLTRRTTEANGLYAYHTGLAALIKSTQQGAFAASAALAATVARETAATIASTALVDNNFRTSSALSQKGMAESLAAEEESPWSTHYASLAGAFDTFEGAMAPELKTRETAIARADAGVDSEGTLTGGGRIALAESLRVLQHDATQEQHADAVTAADAALAAALGGSGEGGENDLPVLEPVTLPSADSFQPPPSSQEPWHAELLSGSALSKPKLPPAPALNSSNTFLNRFTIPKNLDIAEDDHPRGAAAIRVEDARQSLQEMFGQSATAEAAAAEFIEKFTSQGVPLLAPKSPLEDLPEGLKVDWNWSEQEVDRAATALALGSKPGPMTAAQQLEFQRYKSLIQQQRGIEFANRMQFGQRRDVLLEELKKGWNPLAEDVPGTLALVYDRSQGRLGLGPPGSIGQSYDSMSYKELQQHLAKHLPENTDVNSWLDRKIADDYLAWLEERFAGLNQYNQRDITIDLIQLGLDIGGVFDPTPVVDGVNTFISVARGEPIQAGISAITMLPWLLDGLKLLKIPRYIETVRAVVQQAVRHPEVARVIQPILVRIDAIFDAVPWERLPENVAESWKKLRDEVKEAVDRVAEAITNANFLDDAARRNVWNLEEKARGKLVERHLAVTEYKDWWHIGEEHNGYFPLIDFHKGTTVVSLKTADTKTGSWLADIRNHIRKLKIQRPRIDGQAAETVILDLRVQPGGAQAAQQLINFGEQFKVVVRISEFGT